MQRSLAMFSFMLRRSVEVAAALHVDSQTVKAAD